MNTNVLILVVGISGIGKSTYIAVNAPEHSYAVISTDKLRTILGSGESDMTVNEKVFTTATAMAEYLLKYEGRHVVIDATNTTRWSRQNFIKAARKQGCQVHVWLCPLDIERALKQNSLRERQVPVGVITDQIKKYEAPTLEEVDEIIPVPFYD